VHRPLIRATLPRPEGQASVSRQGPEFTIRQPGGRGNRFRPREQREARPFQTNWSAGGGKSRGGGRHNSGHQAARPFRRQGGGRKPSK
jgi:hypothetical protein